ncbi:MAG: hypothetical protein LPK02_07385 [Rhodobacterales bacterium]|nr:hypothetical protein [Rhodobacterales bacterium]
MLIKPTFIDKRMQDPIARALTLMTAGSAREAEAASIDGYAVISHWNPEFVIKEIAAAKGRSRDDFDFAYPELETPEGDHIPIYGVCDSVEQFDALFGDTLRAHEHSFIVTFVEIRRADQHPNGGWRYHKWGEYVGTQEPMHEYLYDDKHIDRVFTFHINRVM